MTLRPLTVAVALMLPLVVFATPFASEAAQSAAYRLPVPPAGGLTAGVAGTTDPSILARSQIFPIDSVATFDVRRQRWLVFIPGAPWQVNTLGSHNLSEQSVVFARRSESGELLTGPQIAAAPSGPPAPTLPQTFAVPPGSGLTLGVTGTDDIDLLLAMQRFEVQSISLWRVATQRYDIFIPGTPSIVNTLGANALRRTSIVWLKGSGVLFPGFAQAAGPPPDGFADDNGDQSTGGGGGGGSIAPAPPPPPGGSPPPTPPPPFPTPPPGPGGTPTPGPSPTPGPTATPTATPTPAPTGTPGPSPTPGPTATPTATPTPPGPGTPGPGPGDPPTAVDDTAVTPEDTPITVDVVANDIDPEGAPLTVTIVTPGAHGTVSIVDARRVRYSPAEHFNGSDSFTYTITDGGSNSTASVSVTVTAVDDPPTAVADTASTPHATAVTINVLANDSDPDGDNVSVVGVGSPPAGTVVDNGDGTVTYTPPFLFSGAAVFSYTIADPAGNQSSANVAVNVAAIVITEWNASSGPPTIQSGTGVHIRIIYNNAIAWVASVGPGSFGQTFDNGDGSVTYIPNAGFLGTDTISWTIQFASGGTATTALSIFVVP